MEALVDGKCEDYMKNKVGVELTEANVGKLQAWFNQEGGIKVSQEKDDSSTEYVTASDTKTHIRLSEAVEIGVIDSRSYLGQGFREYSKKTRREIKVQ